MKDNWFENSLNDKLSRDHGLIDKDGLWAELELKRKKKKRQWLPLLMLGLFLIVFSGVLITQSILQSNSTKSSTNSIHQMQEVARNDVEITDSPQDIIAQPNDLNSDGDKAKTKLQSQVQAQAQAQAQAQSSLENLNHAGKINTQDNSNKRLKLDPSPIHIKNTEESSSLHSELKANKTSEDQLIKNNKTDDSSIENHKIRLTPPLAIGGLALKVLAHNYTAPQVLKFKPSIQLSENQTKTKQVSIASEKFLFGVSSFYGLANRDLMPDSEIHSELINVRNGAEEMLDHLGLGFHLSKKLNSFIRLESGLILDQYTTRSIYSVNEIDNFTTIDTVSILLDSENNLISYQEGEKIGTTTTSKELRYYQKYRSVSIPLLARMRLLNSKKLSLNMTFGANFGINMFSSGVHIDNFIPSLQFVDISGEESHYKKSILLSGIAKMGISYPFNNSLNLRMDVSYQKDLSNRINTSKRYSDRFTSINLELGVYKVF